MKLGLVTARSVTNYERVFTTLREWGVQLDEVIFCGGKKKGPFLKAFGADIFFDDTQPNISKTVKQLVTDKKVLEGKELDEVLDLRAMTELGVPGGGKGVPVSG